ncbi:MAG: TatD family deoxyribonuclease [Blastochloris viridis]|uniref:TatD family deoxyribonuclease n=1 Tax=Blastochloris viridis TaxID=1079 RepID=A0A6N4RBC2_BLAVI|nr:MAG: TatD family deoxyribonuclease [Blastochloris viridis]
MIDSHTHLMHSRFQQEEPPITTPQLISTATAAGVEQMVNIACRRAEWLPSLEVCKAHPEVFMAAGIHPQDVAEEELIHLDELLAVAENQKVVALGETGLDYFYENSPKSQQHTSFHTHLEACVKTGLPAVIHTRDAEEDTVAILKDHPGAQFVLHCFTGTPWLAEQGVAMGGYISFSGILTFKKSQELRDIAASLPRDKVLIETDAPYLAPDPFRGKRNAPHLLPHTCETLAKVWQVSTEEAAKITADNTRRLFSRMAAM